VGNAEASLYIMALPVKLLGVKAEKPGRRQGPPGNFRGKDLSEAGKHLAQGFAVPALAKTVRQGLGLKDFRLKGIHAAPEGYASRRLAYKAVSRKMGKVFRLGPETLAAFVMHESGFSAIFNRHYRHGRFSLASA
jgi:hypothetical protein